MKTLILTVLSLLAILIIGKFPNSLSAQQSPYPAPPSSQYPGGSQYPGYPPPPPQQYPSGSPQYPGYPSPPPQYPSSSQYPGYPPSPPQQYPSGSPQYPGYPSPPPQYPGAVQTPGYPPQSPNSPGFSQPPPSQASGQVPGVDLSRLNEQQRAQVMTMLNGEGCPCGCQLNLLRCRIEDSSCPVSLQRAQAIVTQVGGAPAFPMPPPSAPYGGSMPQPYPGQ